MIRLSGLPAICSAYSDSGHQPFMEGARQECQRRRTGFFVRSTRATRRRRSYFMSIAPSPLYKRIDTEEAFATPDLLDEYRKLLASGRVNDPGFESWSAITC